MLFNTAWNKTPEVKPVGDLLSTARLQAWLEKQPAGQYYTYSSPYFCLLANYLKAHGGRDVRVSTHFLVGGPFGSCTRIPSAFFDAVTPQPHTYGAALKRLKAFV